MEVVLITPEGEVVPFARAPGPGHAASEVTGPVFNPAGDRLYFSSQRGQTARTAAEILGLPAADVLNGGLWAGVTWEVTGPFRGRIDPPSPTTTIAEAAGRGATDDGDDGSGGAVAAAAGIGAVAVAAGGAAWWWLQRRNATAGTGGGDHVDGPDPG
jgi:hypothetical protein